MDNISKTRFISFCVFFSSFRSPAVLLISYVHDHQLYLAFFILLFEFLSQHVTDFCVLMCSRLCIRSRAFADFPKSHPIKFLNLFFALHSRIFHRWWWCQMYVFAGTQNRFHENKNCETEIKLNSKQQFTPFNGCIFFLLFSGRRNHKKMFYLWFSIKCFAHGKSDVNCFWSFRRLQKNASNEDKLHLESFPDKSS